LLTWHTLEASGFEARQQWRLALVHLDALIAARPDDPLLRLRRAKALQYLEEGERVLIDHSKVTEVLPTVAGSWRERGNVYARLGRWDEAIADYSTAVELQRQELDAAPRASDRTKYQRVVQIKVALAEDCTTLGDLLRQTGALDQASAAYEEAILHAGPARAQ